MIHAVLAVLPLVLLTPTGGAMNPQREIRLTMRQTRFAVGEAIPITVTYVNRGAQPLTFRDPAKTWEVGLSVTASDGGVQRVQFGRLFRQNFGQMSRMTLESADEITLEPEKEYAFECDAGERWPWLFPAGFYRLQVNDRTNDDFTLFSNEIDIAVVLTVKSVGRLLDLVADEKAELASRQYAADWIQRIYPPFLMHLTEPTPAQKLTNQEMLDVAGAWWRAHRGTTEVKEKIDAINKTAGVEDVRLK
jgi:hypothetical protein